MYVLTKKGKVRKIEYKYINYEKFLQELFPKLINYISNEINVRLMVLGNEVFIKKNRIDQIAIDNKGNIYLIEFKLARNSDKRHVLSQLIEYASLLEGVTVKTFFETNNIDLNKIKNYFGIDKKSIKKLKENLEKNLKEGYFIFVLVMDKIDENLRRIINYFRKRMNVSLISVELETYKYNSDVLLNILIDGADDIKKEYEFDWHDFYLKLGDLESVVRKIKSFCEENDYIVIKPDNMSKGMFIALESNKKPGKNKMFYIFKITEKGKIIWNAWHHGIKYFPPLLNKVNVLKELFRKLEKIEGAKIDYKYIGKQKVLDLHLSNLSNEKELKKFLDVLLWIKKKMLN